MRRGATSAAHRPSFDGALASAAVESAVMDPPRGQDPELEGTAESAQQGRVLELLASRPRPSARPSASEPVRRFERGLSLPLRGVPQPPSPEFSWAPARVGSNRPAAVPRQEHGRSPPRQPPRQRSPRRRSLSIRNRGSSLLAADLLSVVVTTGTALAVVCPPRAIGLLSINPLVVGQASAHPERDPPQRSPRRSPATRGRGSPGRRWDSGRREQSPPRPRSAGSGGRRGRRNGGGRGGNGRGQDPALDQAADVFAEVVRQARASGEETHVHIAVTNGPPLEPSPGQAAPLRAPTLRDYLPAREGRAPFRTPRPVQGFSVPRFSVGRTPGWPTVFPREAPTAPPPIPAGRDPMLTMCRLLNLVEACEVVANLQLAVCGATRSFPSSYGPGSRGSCVSLAESLESPLAPVSEAPAGVAPLARTFPRHVGDLVGVARVGTPVDTLQSSAHLLLSMSACMRSMLEVEGAEPYAM
ncbi:unnamed protein product [Closterium sp. Yama58-4]|nr:unnamed protein product [Closterium sp. Yama58-4]